MSNTLERREPTGVANAESSRDGMSFVPRFDVCETDDELVLYGDLPGVEPGDVDVQCENNQLIIHGKVAPRQDGRKYLYAEYGIGDFHRSFTIGEVIDVAKISAEMSNGVLTIHLPKSESVKPRRIKVQSK